MSPNDGDRIVLFDVDGVVLYPGSRIRLSSRPWYAELSNDLGIDTGRLSERFFSAPLGGGASPMDLCTTGRAAIEDVLPPILTKLGYTEGVDTFLAYWFERDAYVDPALIGEIETLRTEGYRCYLATSQEHRRARFLWEELGLRDRFAGMYYSAALGLSKKSLAFFRAVSADLGCAAPLYFDDCEDMVHTATVAGWRATLYTSLETVRNHPEIGTRRGGAYGADRATPPNAQGDARKWCRR